MPNKDWVEIAAALGGCPNTKHSLCSVSTHHSKPALITPNSAILWCQSWALLPSQTSSMLNPYRCWILWDPFIICCLPDSLIFLCSVQSRSTKEICELKLLKASPSFFMCYAHFMSQYVYAYSWVMWLPLRTCRDSLEERNWMSLSGP